MAGFIQRIMQERKNKKEEQQQRINRLKELEASSNQRHSFFQNPIQAIKEKNEIKKLQKEIDAHNDKVHREIAIVIGVCVVLVCIVASLIMAFFETNSDVEDSESDTKITITNEQEVTTLATTASAQTTISFSTTNTTEATTLITTQTTMLWDGKVIEASDLSVNTETDYAHIDSDLIILGNDEGVTVTVSANQADVTVDDLLFYYDESDLDVQIGEPNVFGERTTIELYVTGEHVGVTELVICTVYDVVTKGEDFTGYQLKIKKLDSEEGKIVYITPSGEKYHFSEGCISNNGKKTTYYDAKAYEYEACSKCAW